jgi:hypothetical protein
VSKKEKNTCPAQQGNKKAHQRKVTLLPKSQKVTLLPKSHQLNQNLMNIDITLREFN